MKINNKVFICALLVLMLFLCINACSADETLNETLGTDSIDEIAIEEVPENELSASGDTIVVDANGDGDYATISDAVGAATGGETIFIKNGQYVESQPVSIGKSLSIVGESRENVIISGGSNGVFTNPTDDSSLKLDIMLKDLTIKDVTCTGSFAPVRIYYCDIALDVINCTFVNCDSKSGAMQVGTTTANIDGCKILNSKNSQGGGSSATAIAFSSGGTYTMNNCEINGASSSQNNYATLYFTATSGTLDIDNLTVVNCQGTHQSLIRGANGNKITIRNSVIANNTLNRFNDYQKDALFFVGKGELIIEQSVIANNTFEDEFVRDLDTTSKTTINYCNIYNNSRYSHYKGSAYDLEANYWGSNNLPDDVTANTYVVEDNGEYKLNTGEDLEKEIPELTGDGEPVADLIVNIVSDYDAVQTGEQVTFNITVANDGPDTAFNNAAHCILPDALVYVSCELTAGYYDDSVSVWYIGDLEYGEFASLIIYAMAVNEGITAITDVEVYSDTYDHTLTNNFDTCSVDILSESGVIYVSTTGSDYNDGLSQANAVATLKHAIEIAEGKIIILSGEYTQTEFLNITKDLDIVGEGDVTVKSNVAERISYEVWDDWDEEWVTETKTVYTLIENNANLNLSNIKFALVPASINMEMITNNANLFINDCEFNNIKVTSSKGVIQNIKTAKLEVNGTTFSASTSTYGAINSNGELLVNNSRFVDADRTGEGAVYSTAITAYNRATITNTEFKNNKGGSGGAVYVMYSYTNKENPVVEINNCTFEENEATGTYGDGAAIKCSGNQVTLTVTNSTFNNNTATRNGGAIYAQGTVIIDQCAFTQNIASTANTIYAYGGIVEISNSVILDEGVTVARYESSYSDPATVTANDNWWGTNDQPTNVGDNIAVDDWVKMNATLSPSQVQAGDEVIVTATFDNDKLPDGVIKVTFTSTSGNLNEVAVVNNGQATATYTIDANDVDITVTSSDAVVVLPIEAPLQNAIYVSVTGDDANDGFTKDTAVATIAKAYELVPEGGIIYLLDGTHKLEDYNNDYGFYGVLLEKSVSFVGESVENTIVDAIGDAYFLVDGSEFEFLTFENITFDKVGAEPIISIYGSVDELNIKGCRFIDYPIQAVAMMEGVGKLTVSDSILIGGESVIYIFSGATEVDIHNNILFGSSQYQIVDEEGTITGRIYENLHVAGSSSICNVLDVESYVIANVTVDPSENIEVGEQATVSIDFNSYVDSEGNVVESSNLIPDFTMDIKADGTLSADSITLEDGAATFTYSSDEPGEDEILFNYRQAKVASIKINSSIIDKVIYVLPGASDSNPGTRDEPVGTIAHALEISRGQIVLLEGIHKTGDLGIISNDLNITGEGNAIIDADNNNKILFVGEEAKVIISNVAMINGYSAEESGALLGNGNELIIINCTLANSSAAENNAGAIYSAGKLTIINTTIANCSAREGGAIFTQDPLAKGNTIILINSTLENNIASGNDNLGGGAILAQQITEFTIDNTSFINNVVRTTASGGAIYISHSAADVKITNSAFIANHANGKPNTGGGAIYRAPTSNYQKEGTMTITGTLFENNTCDGAGGAIYARATTVNVANSVLINNTDANGLAIYGYRTDTVTPTITLNDNWWGSNDSPKGLVGGNDNYKPTLNRWAILTVTNDTAIVEGNTVKLTVSINDYTTGTENGTLSSPITVARDVVITTTFDNIEGVLENGEFAYDLTVPSNLKYVSATVDNETVVLFVVSSDTIVELDDITAKKYGVVNVSINVTTTDGAEVDSGIVELYAGDDLIAIIPVSNGKAEKEVTFGLDEGTYELIAKFIDDSGIYSGSESNATLTVSGIIELRNETFFNFFDENGILKEEINEDELVFHGVFSGLGVSTITINKPMLISGDEAVLYDMAYKLASDDITLTNVSLISQGTDFTLSYGAAIYANGVNIVIDNVSVEYNAPSDKEAFAIYAKTADEFKLINSEIKFTGNNHDYSKVIHQYGVHISDSSDVLIADNIIAGSLPALDVAYSYLYPELVGIYQDLVAIIAVQGGSNINITENAINVSTDGGYGLYPTISSVLVNGVDDLLVNFNNITHTDLTSEDVARYYYTVDLYSSNVIVESNNILLNTTSGINRAGTAYPIQLTGPINALINKNNLTSISKGPNLGIFSADWDGDVVVTITDNLINITGYSTENNTALVSGMELQAEFAYVYNNTIYTYNIGKYDDVNSIYGISYAQWYYGDHSFDIRENTIFTEGKYAVFILNGVNTNVTDNILYAHELCGDGSATISGGSGNVIKNNYPVKVNVSVAADSVAYGENVIVNVTGSAAGVYTVVVNGVTKDVTVEVAGEFVSVDFGALPVNTEGYGITAIYNDTLKYIGVVNDTEVVIVNKAEIAINVSADGISYGDVLVVDVELPADILAVNVTVGDETKEVTLTDGKGSVEFAGLGAGEYTVVASYAGDENYNNASASADVKVSRATPTIKVTAEDIVYGDDLVVNVELSADATRRAIVTIGNESKLVHIENGTGSVKFSGLAAGTYDVTATYNGDSNYDRKASANTTVKVTRATPNIKVTAKNIKAGEDLVVNVKVSDSITRRVIVTIGNESKLVHIENGTGSVKFSGLTKGTYTVTATYNGDANYDRNAFANTTVTVYKGPANIIATAEPVSFGEDVVIDIQLPSDISRRVNVTLGNETKLVSLANGTASVKFSGLAVGTYNAVVSYNGDENYAKSSVNVTTKVVKATPDIQITTGDITVGEPLTVDVQLPADVSRRATVTVGNESKAVILKEGIGSVKFTGLEAGTYDVVVSYNGDSNYKASSNSTAVEVKA